MQHTRGDTITNRTLKTSSRKKNIVVKISAYTYRLVPRYYYNLRPVTYLCVIFVLFRRAIDTFMREFL